MRKPKILVLAGSTRKDSIHRKLAPQIVEALQAAGLDATFADLRDYPMPLYEGDLEATEGMPLAAKALKDVARDVDAFVIASPEYNGSYPAVQKNAIDWISRPEPGERHLHVFADKLAAILSASPGPGGGRRVLQQLRQLLEMIRVTVIPQDLSIPRAAEALDADGRLTRPEDIEGLHALVDALASELSRKLERAA
ncbi:MAG: NADPH-dependent reductase [Candidatus Solibacter sp.]|nr:NADPH-dependent reductase [Candidatus Solibacter sp.]